jgi:hypothetical protein
MPFLIALYAAAMTLANLSIAQWGPWVSPINAFLFIGLDFALRDLIHERLKTHQMGLLIAATGLLTYVLNPAAGIIAIASAVSFTGASVVDWGVFTKASGTWFKRSTKSNVAGAAVDSLLFPTIAFGALMPQIVLAQFLAKVAGGVAWGFLINKLLVKNAA